MTAPAASPPEPTQTFDAAFEDDRYDAIVEFADKAISYRLSVREAAYRRERPTLEIHCPQIRVLTLAVFEAVKTLRARPDAIGRAL